MKKLWLGLVPGVAAVLLAALGLRAGPPAADLTARPAAAAASVARDGVVSLPLAFEENGGQVDPEVRFLARAPGMTTFLTARGPVFGLPGGASFRVRVRGASGGASLETREPYPGVVSYFVGNEPARWQVGLRTFGEVRQRAVVLGVDLVFHGSDRQLEFDLDCSPEVDPSSLALEYEGVDALTLTDEGDLRLTVGGREVVQRRPKVWQVVDGARRDVGSAYELVASRAVAFRLGARDTRFPVVIDPVVQFASYVGGNGTDYLNGVAVTPDGGLFLAGQTDSTNFPTSNSLGVSSTGATRGYVMRVVPSTGTVLYTAYFGGSGTPTSANSVAVDPSSGTAVVVGSTTSTDFPVVGAAQSANRGTSDAFVLRLSPSGTALYYSTYLGATTGDSAEDVALDSAGAAYVVGWESGSNFPATVTTFQSTGPNFTSSFAAKLNPDGGLAWATPLGGNVGTNFAYAVALDSSKNVYVAGSIDGAASMPFPVAGFSHGPQGGNRDAWLVKLNPTGTTQVYSAQFGGAGLEEALGVAVDATGSAYVVGSTSLGTFTPLVGAVQAYAANNDGFLVKVAANGNSVVFSTFLGGTGNDYARGVTFDPVGNVVVSGGTNTGFPAINPLRAFGSQFQGSWVAALPPTGSPLLYEFLIGEGSADHAGKMDPAGWLTVGGVTSTTNQQTVNPVQPGFDGGFFDVIVRTVDLYSPHLLAFQPKVASSLGGGAFTFTAWNLQPGGTVTTGGTALTFSQLSDGGYAGTFPALLPGTADVVISNPGGGSDQLTGWLAVYPPPTPTSLVPNRGPATLGQNVAILGTAFSPDSGVTIGGLTGAPIAFVDAGMLTARAAIHAAGTVDIVVTNSLGISGTLVGGFTYDPPPTVATVLPAFGPVGGGATVTVTGTSFVSGATVTVDGVAATSVVVLDPATLTAVTPARPASGATAATVVVRNPDLQTGTLAAAYRYWAPPVIASITPGYGTERGGTPVTLQGSGLRPGMTLTLGGAQVTGLVVGPPSDAGQGALSAAGVTAPWDAGFWTIVAVNLDGQLALRDGGFRYVEQPVVTSAAPAIGPTVGNTEVFISGAGFAADASVTIGGLAATVVPPVTGTLIHVRTAPGFAGPADVTVTNPPGVSGTLDAGYVYRGPPVVATVSPSAGPSAGGTFVTVSGLNFGPDAGVTFGGVTASQVFFQNANQLGAITPSHVGGPADVVVTVDGVPGTLAGGFTYTSGPLLTSLAPNQGPSTGGTQVRLLGGNFAAGANVTFGGLGATSVVLIDAGVLQATTPPHAAGSPVDVVVTNPDTQSTTLAQAFTYVVPPATIASVSPALGPSSGGTPVTITGTNFDAQATVQFGGVQATGVTLLASTVLTATTPPHAGGLVDVVVTVQGVPLTKAAAFTYQPGPKLSTLDPTTGAPSGGTTVTLRGQDFSVGAKVAFGGVEGTSVTLVDAGVLTAVTPAHAAGLVDVTVTNPDQQRDTKTQAFTFVVAAPTVSAIVPTTGLSVGGTSVIIAGTNFDSTATVLIGGVAATDVAFLSSTTLSAKAPPHPGGVVDVVVTVQGQTGTLPAAFTYLPGPKLIRVDPLQGPPEGGTAFTLSGTNFQPGATVTLDGQAALNLVRVDATSMTGVTPKHAAGRVDLVVVNPDSQSDTLPGGFEYVDPGVGLVARSRYLFSCASAPGDAAWGAFLLAAWVTLRARRRGRSRAETPPPKSR